jgi:mono/diheme cytochrome c family protein
MVGMNKADPANDARACEALWVSCGLGQPEREFLLRCLNARSHAARAAAVEVIRNEWRRMPDHADLLIQAARDTHPRVRLAAIVAASWIGGKDGANILVEALNQPVDRWMIATSEAAIETLKPHLTSIPVLITSDAPTSQAATPQQADDLSSLSPEEQHQHRLGHEVFHRDSHCATCHGAEGKGDAVYPPLVGSEWIRGNEERLVKLALKGLWGPIEVDGRQYDPAKGVPPMIGFEHLLNDQELAAVLSYVRRRFGNGSPPVKPATVARIRETVRSKTGFYTVEELLREHPLGP